MPDKTLDVLRAHLCSGQPAIVMVDWRPRNGKLDTHFMAAGDVTTGGDIVVWDSWWNEVAPVTRRYGRTPAIALVRFNLFEMRGA